MMTSERKYWLSLFNFATWQTFLETGARVVGFRERRWPMVQKMKVGDYLLCYLTGVSRWIGALAVIEEPYLDYTPIWQEDIFAARVPVKPVVTLAPETAVPILELRNSLSVFQTLGNPNAWTSYFRQSPANWRAADGDVVLEALVDATVSPVVRDVDQRRLARKSPILKNRLGSFAVPDSMSDDGTLVNIGGFRELGSHTEMQWLLLKLGNDMGLDVWVARNDRGREYNRHKFSELPRLRAALPRQFDAATTKIIELIDVLWLQKSAIVAAFEIESTTSIYSGLLRMSDLVAMQPNLQIPLYIVAPDERRNKVMSEINRPTFNSLRMPLREICRFIAFSELRAKAYAVDSVIRYLQPDFIQEIAEPCNIEQSS